MKITVTAGHGANDPGNTWGGTTESALMTNLRFIVAFKLKELGYEVVEDGGRGENLPLNTATGLIQGSAVSIELHTNASANASATGVEVVAAPKDKELAQSIALGIAGVLEIPLRRDGGWYPLDQIVRERGFTPGFVRRGGLIVETFFQSNPTDLAKFQASKWLVADAIAKAIDSHVRGKA